MKVFTLRTMLTNGKTIEKRLRVNDRDILICKVGTDTFPADEDMMKEVNELITKALDNNGSQVWTIPHNIQFEVLSIGGEK